MLKGVLFIILLVFVFGAILLLIAVNFVMSIIRRIRRSYFGEGEDEDYFASDTMRRQSNQYSYHRTNTSAANGQPRQRSSQSYQTGDTSQRETIVDTRDPNSANRQIISDDEGEYVDFVEEN